MKKHKSFHLAGYRSSPEVESHENWAVLSLFAIGMLFLLM